MTRATTMTSPTLSCSQEMNVGRFMVGCPPESESAEEALDVFVLARRHLLRCPEEADAAVGEERDPRAHPVGRADVVRDDDARHLQLALAFHEQARERTRRQRVLSRVL